MLGKWKIRIRKVEKEKKEIKKRKKEVGNEAVECGRNRECSKCREIKNNKRQIDLGKIGSRKKTDGIRVADRKKERKEKKNK